MLEQGLTNASKIISNMVILPPLQQFKSGIAAEDVICKDGYQLVVKLRNNSPACVKPTSIAKLVAWGWAKPSG